MLIKTANFTPRIKPRTSMPSDGWPSQLNGACLVDNRGIETPITEAMIRGVLDKLEVAWHHENARRENQHKR
tara:strand:- start:216 stop:431 length:216 start_codon:yes stop_codon:yes gene_type:complete